MSFKFSGRLLAAIVILFAQWSLTQAQAQAPKRDAEAEMKAALTAARAVQKTGPIVIPLGAQASIKLPEGFVFIPHAEAEQLMRAMGNSADANRLGLIFPASDANYFVVVKYHDAGYIKDDEARDWKVDEMLEQFKSGTLEGNKERAELGIAPMEVVGWVQSPKYDAATHRLVWSIESKDVKEAAGAAHGINYNTFLLGREGYLSLNLVTGMATIEQEKPAALTLLNATTFNDGKRYADFNSSTDKVAEYGIAALVAGVAAKKLGLFAILAAFLLKFAKVFAIGAFAGAGGLKKFFSWRKDKKAVVPVSPVEHDKSDNPP